MCADPLLDFPIYVNAENYKNFTPSSGKVVKYHPPGGVDGC